LIKPNNTPILVLLEGVKKPRHQSGGIPASGSMKRKKIQVDSGVETATTLSIAHQQMH
jgi:hypothetical protein